MRNTYSSVDRRLRLLFVLPHVPGLAAPSGGARVSGHLVAGLAARHETAVLCLRRPHDPPADDSVQRACVSYEEVASESDRPVDRSWRVRLRTDVTAVGGTPRSVRRTSVPALHGRLSATARDWQPDVVHVCHDVIGHYVSDLRQCPARRVLTVYEPGITAAREAAPENGSPTLRQHLEARAWTRYERRVLHEFDSAVVLTECDRATLAALGAPATLVHIPLGVAIPERPCNPLGLDPPSVLFVGNFAHPPNVDAALRLARAIHPRVRRACPTARLLLVGAGAPERLAAVADATITVAGAVKSVMPFMEAAAVVAAPLRRGGGMRVKVMEALAAGKAVVASPLAVDGLNVCHGQQALVADDDVAFASAVVAVLENAALRQALGLRARQWACSHLAWDRSIAAYDALYARLCRRPATAARVSQHLVTP